VKLLLQERLRKGDREVGKRKHEELIFVEKVGIKIRLR